ncbi:hypothetical protein SSX86_020231 [Deinandra increscens subsp. villosa]|uniref:Replication protein A 32 kDa subunit n=1 Tax=Deinandra increscens subsp. villosa TaxID=3103831 RepID=A0AAP0CSQ5_9ASTR
MNAGKFDGAAAFSGGGFMPSQATQNADPVPSVLSKHRDTQTLIPLTVKQINDALQSNDDKVNFLIDGVDVNNVKLVGMVFDKAERVTDISFKLDDGTGHVDCNRWVHDPVDTKEMEALSDGMYVRVHGQLKGFQGKKQLVVFVSYLFIVHQFTGQYVADRLDGNYKMVLDYLNLPGSLARGAGVHQEELARQLGIPLDQIVVTLTCLVDEGLVYNSIDDYHFKSADTQTYQTIASNQFTGQYVADGPDGNYKMVLDYLNLPRSLATLACLVDEALVYNSIDDYHFKSADTGTYQTIPSNQFTGQYVADGLNGNYKMVLDYLNLPGSLAREAGVHQQELASRLGIPLEQIMITLTCLVDEELVYNSIDDYHFKSAANA